MSAPTARVPPHDIDAEGVVLSVCLGDAGRLGELMSVVTATDFYSTANRHIWCALTALLAKGLSVDTVAVASELRARGKLEAIGGTPYLGEILTAPCVANVVDHAKTIAELGLRRRLIEICQHAAATGYGDVGTTSEWAGKLEKNVFEAICSDVTTQHSTSPHEGLPALINEIDLRRRQEYDELAARQVKATYATIPWEPVRNALCGGLRLSKMHVLAGRPGMGKTAAALGFALGSAKHGDGVVFISLEMTEEELLQRALSSDSAVPLPVISSGEPSAEQWVRITQSQMDLDSIPLRIAYAPGAKITEIRSIARREVARIRRDYGVKTALVVVDYIQIVDGERKHGDSRENEIAGISRRLMTLGGELGVAVLALSQLSREVERRTVKRPQLSDLRESGAIEQDAFSIMFMYRAAYYSRNTSDIDDLELIIAKHRNGPLSTVKLRFNGPCVRIDAP